MRLFTVDECEALGIEEVWGLYRQYVNPGQVDLIASFGFGRELVEKAEGAWIITRSGRRILDFTGGVGVLNHGHNHPRILQARRRYEERRRMEVHKNFFSPYVAALSHNIAQLLPGDLEVCYFPNSGAEAVEGAMKLAYKYHGGRRAHVLHSDISFHGKLFGSASVTGSPELHFRFPQIPGVAAFAYDDLGSVQALVDRLRQADGSSDVYAVLVEPLNASSLRACSERFLVGLRQLCEREDIVLIFDEVYTGWAKTGELFHFMRYPVIPDVLTMAKSFGGGKASIAGFVARRGVFKKAYGNLHDALLHSTTYNAFGEETATALEAVNIVVEDDYVGRARRIEARLRPGLEGLQEKFPELIAEVRGAGALQGLLLEVDPGLMGAVVKLIPSDFFRDERFLNKLVTAAVIGELYSRHGILSFYGSNREIPMIISPPLVVSDEDLDYFLSSLEATLTRGVIRLVLSFLKTKYFSR